MSSSSDPFSGIIQYMNEYRRDSLLLYAWSLMGHKNTVSATMTELTLSSFTLKLNKKSPFGQNKEIECTYNFETKLLAPSEAKYVWGECFSRHLFIYLVSSFHACFFFMK